ncbi:MAG: hypothetical protein CMK83_19905 [Pseudomonadales bacterium]|nr:hypothetical protein [Pseudomonadales bacterium]MEC8812208.1 DUF4299 family protein [Pseudomonadota bacterium]HAG94237.1 hypothetical protein [Gammaproteobacteria bacterium]MAQ26479.1 hypothetical protein [Pseudomonadales bacterium]MBI27217.1 hypothetical protein [Pseudomonadales bacterium]|tara:strand:- start:32 stop:1408 length:1377 start_codon:yes stop_codon:yes gene_type:complete
MSHSFYLKPIPQLDVAKVMAATGYNDVRFVEGYPQPQADAWPQGLTYVYRDEVSARALEVDYSDEVLQVRIFAASSPDDYRLALKLVEAVASLHGTRIEPEDNEEMTLPDFQAAYGEAWLKDHCKSCLAAILQSYTRNPESSIKLSGVNRTMELGKRVFTQMTQDKSRVAQEFFARLKKLNYFDKEDVYQATIIVLGNKQGDRNVRLSTYTEGVPTLFVDKNTLITLVSDADLSRNDDERKQQFVPLHELARMIGERAQWISENVLLAPGLSGDEWQRLQRHAAEVAVDDMFEYGFDPHNDPFAEAGQAAAAGPLSDDDIKLLAYAPIAVFCIVAAADGSIDKKEVKAFQVELLKGIITDSELMQKVMVHVVSDFEGMIGAFLKQEVDAKEKLEQILRVLDGKLSAEESHKFKVSMLSIGKSVAEASGGFLGMFGSKISKEEKRALVGLAMFLGLAGE